MGGQQIRFSIIEMANLEGEREVRVFCPIVNLRFSEGDKGRGE